MLKLEYFPLEIDGQKPQDFRFFSHPKHYFLAGNSTRDFISIVKKLLKREHDNITKLENNVKQTPFFENIGFKIGCEKFVSNFAFS